jgi:hypothetical protein
MLADSLAWPPLPAAAWAETRATLHMWTQIAGKVRLALAPYVNHWWHVPLYVTARGLATSPIPWRRGSFEMTFDFIGHQFLIETSEGGRRQIALAPQTVADFYQRVLAALGDLGIDVHIWPMPVEIPSPIRFDRDTEHGSYDAEAANRFWRVLTQADLVLKEFRGRFIGKCSPVHFFWGSFDLAVSRFNGRRAKERPDADKTTREAYSHETISAGFWPGNPPALDAAFYAYAAPEPDGYKDARVAPAAARYNAELGEYILQYDDVRRAEAPRDTVLEFLQSTYEAGARLAGWDRAQLDKH